MVHLRARASALALEPDDAWMLSGYSRLRLPSQMKNFVRLVQFAWRYRVRFGLSIGCAAMVALLFFTELGAVYPLLHILFDSQNPKRWVAEKITSIENEIVFLDARATEANTALQFAEAKNAISRCSERATRPCTTTTSSGRQSCSSSSVCWVSPSSRKALASRCAMSCRSLICCGRRFDWQTRGSRSYGNAGGCSIRAAPGISRRILDIADEKSDRRRSSFGTRPPSPISTGTCQTRASRAWCC